MLHVYSYDNKSIHSTRDREEKEIYFWACKAYCVFAYSDTSVQITQHYFHVTMGVFHAELIYFLYLLYRDMPNHVMQ
jgi:hypothetical protein